jgi:hypothetical protein
MKCVCTTGNAATTMQPDRIDVGLERLSRLRIAFSYARRALGSSVEARPACVRRKVDFQLHAPWATGQRGLGARCYSLGSLVLVSVVLGTHMAHRSGIRASKLKACWCPTVSYALNA